MTKAAAVQYASEGVVRATRVPASNSKQDYKPLAGAANLPEANTRQVPLP